MDSADNLALKSSTCVDFFGLLKSYAEMLDCKLLRWYSQDEDMDNLSPEHRGWLMSRVKSKNTTLEMEVRRLVFGLGFRYRLHDKRLPGKPDLVFWRRRKAIFINGCFWHGHKGCRYARLPKTHVGVWKAKIKRNRARDRESIAFLKGNQWKVLTVWQCELKKRELLATKLYDFIESE